jgi:hypothetical protein
VLFSNNIIAQSGRTIERTISGETYLIDTISLFVKNKNYKLPEGKQCDSFTIEDSSPLEKIFYNFLSKEKMNELVKSKAMVVLRIVCLPSGKIEAVSFLFRKKIFLSLAEIQSLEKKLINTQLKISTYCSGNHYVSMVAPIRFEKYTHVPL